MLFMQITTFVSKQWQPNMPAKYSPCSPLHKVLAFLLSRNDSLQVYTLAKQVRVGEK